MVAERGDRWPKAGAERLAARRAAQVVVAARARRLGDDLELAGVGGELDEWPPREVFVESEPGLEGLLHIAELLDRKVESPEEVVKVGDEIEVKVLRVDPADRKIGLSRKRMGDEGVEEEAAEGAAETPAQRPQRELRGGTGASTGNLIQMPEPPEKK